MNIPQDVIDTIRRSVHLRDLIGEVVELRRVGSRWVGLCPFHSEKTPSFSVNPEQGFYYCFGCGEHGDAFSFLQRLHGMSFLEAVEELAARTGVRLPERARDGGRVDSGGGQARERRRVVLGLLAEVAQWFRSNLVRGGPEHPARRYLAERGVQSETAERFGLGWAPEAWSALADWLARKRLPLEVAALAGLVVERGGGRGWYDRFRSRLVFPVADAGGRVVGFGGRLVGQPPPGREAAKYINTPDSPVYTKGKVLFGLHLARRAMRQRHRAILVEGNFDLVLMHQAGFEEVVAPMGTALTRAQAELLRRFVAEVILLYDGDQAGRKAAVRSVPLLLEAGVHPRVARLPEGEDPDSFLRRRGADAMARVLEEAGSFADVLLDELVAEHGTSGHGAAAVIEEMARLLVHVDDRRALDVYAARVASALRVREALVADAIEAARRGPGAAAPAGGAGAPSAARAGVPVAPNSPEPRGRQAQLVRWCLQHPAALEFVEECDIDGLIEDASLRRVLWEAIVVVGEHGMLDGAALLTRLADSPLRRWVAKALAREPEFDDEEVLVHARSAVALLERERHHRRLVALQRELADAQRRGDEAAAKACLSELQALRREALHPVTEVG